MRYYELIDEDGTILDGSPAMSALHSQKAASPITPAQFAHTNWEDFTEGNSRIRIMDIPVLGLAGRRYLLRIGTSLDEADDDCRRVQFFLFALVPFIIVAHAANAWIMAARSLRPLEKSQPPQNKSPHSI